LVFTIIMLFGPVVQDLAVPRGGDVAFDVLYTISFVLFIVDIIIRCYVTPNYWAWNIKFLRSLFCCFSKEDTNKSNNGTGETSTHRTSGGAIKAKRGSGYSGSYDENTTKEAMKIGSFMFWCDVISTSLLLYNISYINQQMRSNVTIDLTLNERFMVTQGISQVNDSLPLEAQFALFVVIARTARIARFIRVSSVVKLSSKMDWYWVPDHLNPKYWFRRCCPNFYTGKDTLFVNRVDGEKRHSLRQASVALNEGARDTGSNDPEKANIGKKMGFLQSARSFLLGADKEEQKRNNAAILIQRAFRLRNDSTYGLYGTEHPASSQFQYSTDNAASKKSFIDHMKKTMKKTSSKSSRQHVDSQVGSAMRELTGQRVVLGIMFALFFTSLFTFFEANSTNASTMVQLFVPSQSENADFANRSVTVAHNTSVPNLFQYKFVDGSVRFFEISGRQPSELKNREIQQITITDASGKNQTIGLFSIRATVRDNAIVQLVSTIFIIVVWFFGVTAFAGPVMILVVTPIERMIRLLTMLMIDPLGYQNTPRYKKFESEEEEFIMNTKWTNDVLKGMET